MQKLMLGTALIAALAFAGGAADARGHHGPHQVSASTWDGSNPSGFSEGGKHGWGNGQPPGWSHAKNSPGWSGSNGMPPGLAKRH